MSFESAPPRIYVRNLTGETIKKLVFKFELGTMDSKIKKIKPNSKEQTPIPVWGVKLINGGYQNLTMFHEIDSKKHSDIVLANYDRKINLLVEIVEIKEDGSFDFKTKIMGIDEQG